jgi:2-polyprenyl-6-methoxyphenol hydroxylase-like FAD-dependent oxidoreductase
MARIKSALVIGGGVAGPVAALALALRKAGIEATVCEAHDAAAIDAGAMLTLAPNGLAAFDVIGLAGAVRAAGHDLHAMVMEKGNGKRLMATRWRRPTRARPMARRRTSSSAC